MIAMADLQEVLDELMTSGEVCQRLGVTHAAVRTWSLYEHRLPYVIGPGGYRLYRRDVIELFATERERRPRRDPRRRKASA